MTERQPIRILPDLVVSKIAAGEVVERPASVIKELMENAIDAGATQIDVEVSAGGKKRMAVSDNGCGMHRDDALLSVERHATSKIRGIEELEHVGTLGFRGEALAAISAVSQFILTSRAAGQLAGTRICITGGRITEVADAGCPIGTSIEVRNLFFNIPARRKFLRSEPTETAQIKSCFLEQALSHPEIGMRLNADDRELYACLPGSSREERIRELFGRELMRHMKSVAGGSDMATLTGLISEPSCTRSDRSEQYTFVNGRAVHSPVIMAAANEVFRSTVPKGRHPSYFLYIQIPPALVDVNVHPAKREVRFQSPTAIRDLMISSLRSALGSEGADPSIQVAPLEAFTWRLPCPIEPAPSAPQPVVYAAPPPTVTQQPDLPVPALSPAAATPTTASAGDAWSHGRVVGQLQDETVLLETRDGLVMLNPQAARERVIYERMMASRLKGEVASQGLLVAVSVSLAPHAAARVREHMDTLRNMGFGIGEIGQDAFVVESVPACLGHVAADEIITQVAQTLEEGGTRAGKEALIEEQIARIASHASASRNTTADPDTIMRLIDELVRTEMPYTCPHGRPTAILTSYAELARRFGRN